MNPKIRGVDLRGAQATRAMRAMRVTQVGGSRGRFRSRPFDEARRFVRSLGLFSTRAYWEWAKSGARPPDIPARPEVAYARQGWAGYGDWLGTETTTRRAGSFVTYEEARRVVREAGIRSSAEYHVWSRQGGRPSSLPANPWRTYRASGWRGWREFLGTAPTGSRTSCRASELIVRFDRNASHDE